MIIYTTVGFELATSKNDLNTFSTISDDPKSTTSSGLSVFVWFISQRRKCFKGARFLFCKTYRDIYSIGAITSDQLLKPQRPF